VTAFRLDAVCVQFDQKRTETCSPDQTPDGLLHSETCRMIYVSISATGAGQPTPNEWQLCRRQLPHGARCGRTGSLVQRTGGMDPWPAAGDPYPTHKRQRGMDTSQLRWRLIYRPQRSRKLTHFCSVECAPITTAYVYEQEPSFAVRYRYRQLRIRWLGLIWPVIVISIDRI
jgi:hypothetical protein